MSHSRAPADLGQNRPRMSLVTRGGGGAGPVQPGGDERTGPLSAARGAPRPQSESRQSVAASPSHVRRSVDDLSLAAKCVNEGDGGVAAPVLGTERNELRCADSLPITSYAIALPASNVGIHLDATCEIREREGAGLSRSCAKPGGGGAGPVRLPHWRRRSWRIGPTSSGGMEVLLSRLYLAPQEPVAACRSRGAAHLGEPHGRRWCGPGI